MDAATESAFDPGPLQRLRAMQRPGRPNLVERVVDLFVDDAPRKLEEMGRAAAEGDDELLHRSAHTLKSSSANVGAMALSRRCEAIERAVREGRVEAARAAVHELGPTLDHALAWIGSGAARP